MQPQLTTKPAGSQTKPEQAAGNVTHRNPEPGTRRDGESKSGKWTRARGDGLQTAEEGRSALIRS